MRLFQIRLEHGKTIPGKVCIVEGANPLISWALRAADGETQTAVFTEVWAGKELLWDSGWLQTAEQSLRYDGSPLTPGEVCRLYIRVRDTDGGESAPAMREFCLGTLASWSAPWIGEQQEQKDTVISFVRDFDCGEGIASACLFVCGLGYHQISINGRSVFCDPMNPAYSEYEKRSYYTVLPGLEHELRVGGNRIGIEVAAGWRAPHNICYELTERVPDYTGRTQLSAALRIRDNEGRESWLFTDESWRYFYGPIVYTNLFIGERFEAAKQVANWSCHGASLPNPLQAAVLPSPGGAMLPQALEPVMERDIYPAVSVLPVAPDIASVDFGQNIAGVCRIRIPREIRAGQTIEISHMEFLEEDGRLFLAPLRGAASVDTYVAAGDGKDPEYWQPAFTYHGFRYAEVKGYPLPLLREDIVAVSLYTDIASGSRFTCGNALVDRIQKNVVQTEKANLHSVLTDCPQRDERMAWLNDATVRFEETPYNFDIGRLFPKVVRDCIDVQGDDGAITCTAPFAFGACPADPVCTSYLMAGWMAYLHTGNTDILREGYPGFCAWNDFLESKSEGWIVQYSYYGDWASPAFACVNEEHAASNVTPGLLMSTGYFYYNALLLEKISRIIGREEDALCHREKATAIRDAFLKEWWKDDTGIVATGSQGCQSFALWLDILPPSGRQKAADHLHQELVNSEYRQTTGNLCTRYMMDALARYGYIEDAWILITREEYPSLGYMIQHEATTVWERFELKKNPGMNSHNHPMYGAVGYWFYAYLAGVQPLQAGWREFSIAPVLPEKLLSAGAVVATPYGDIAVRWVKRYNEIHLYANVPHGTLAHVHTPWGTQETVKGGFYHWSNPLYTNLQVK